MRARLFVVSSLAVAAVLGASSAAHAYPQGPGGISDKPTTTTTQPPKGPDKVAPTPTTTTTTPQGPDDIAPKPPKGDDPKPPKGPGDIANPQSDPVVDPAPTGNGSGSDLDYGKPTTLGDDEGTDAGTEVQGAVEDRSSQADNNATSPAATNGSSNVPTIVMVLLAGVVGALLALLAGRRRRDDDEHAEQV